MPILNKLSDLKTFMGKTDTVDDSLLLVLMDQVGATIENYLNRKLATGTYTELFTSGLSRYYLRSIPIASITHVKLDGIEMAELTDYVVDHDRGRVLMIRKTGKAVRPLNLAIKYVGGYQTATPSNPAYTWVQVPADLQLAVTMQTSHIFRRRRELGMTSVSLPSGSISLADPLDLFLPIVKQKLDRYRMVWFPDDTILC